MAARLLLTWAPAHLGTYSCSELLLNSELYSVPHYALALNRLSRLGACVKAGMPPSRRLLSRSWT
jgi:hypothetical protein